MKKKKRIHYKNPTIIEAVVEIRFASLIDNQKMEEVLGSEYECKKDELVSYAALFQPTEMSIIRNKPGQVRLRFAIKEQISAQVYPDKFSFHWVGKYPGWDVFQPEFERFWKQLSRIYPEVKVNRVGVRYINMVDQKSIEQKVGYWLRKSSNYPHSILSVKTDYFYSFKRPLKKGRLAQIFIAEGESKIPNIKPLILDIDVVQDVDKPMRSALSNITESLHEEIGNIFQSSISMNYKKCMSKEK